MADSNSTTGIVSFMSPEQVAAAEDELAKTRREKEALEFAAMTPQQRAVYGAFKGGRALGDGLGGIFGGKREKQDSPAVRSARALQTAWGDASGITDDRARLRAQIQVLQAKGLTDDANKLMDKLRAIETLEETKAQNLRGETRAQAELRARTQEALSKEFDPQLVASFMKTFDPATGQGDVSILQQGSRKGAESYGPLLWDERLKGYTQTENNTGQTKVVGRERGPLVNVNTGIKPEKDLGPLLDLVKTSNTQAEPYRAAADASFTGIQALRAMNDPNTSPTERQAAISLMQSSLATALTQIDKTGKGNASYKAELDALKLDKSVIDRIRTALSMNLFGELPAEYQQKAFTLLQIVNRTSNAKINEINTNLNRVANAAGVGGQAATDAIVTGTGAGASRAGSRPEVIGQTDPTRPALTTKDDRKQKTSGVEKQNVQVQQRDQGVISGFTRRIINGVTVYERTQ